MIGEIVIRRVGIAVFTCIVAFLGWRAVSAPEVMSEERLNERLEEYMSIRLRSDDDSFLDLYNLMDPEQRKIKDRSSFLQFYGQGIIQVVEVSVSSSVIDPPTSTATVKMKTKLELQPDKLPKQFRNLSQYEQKDLLAEEDVPLQWIWRDNDWYLRMDMAFVTGKDNGQEIQGFTEEDF